jgi:hypothetical protein
MQSVHTSEEARQESFRKLANVMRSALKESTGPVEKRRRQS